MCRGNLLSTLIPPCQQLNTCLNDSACYFVPDASLDNTACDDGFGFTDGDLCNDLGTCMPGPIIPCFLGDNNAPVLEMRSENPGTALKCETTRAEASGLLAFVSAARVCRRNNHPDSIPPFFIHNSLHFFSYLCALACRASRTHTNAANDTTCVIALSYLGCQPR